MINIGTAMAYLEMDTSGFTNGLEGAGKDLQKFSDSTNSAEDRIKGLSGAMGTAGAGMTKAVTVPLLGAAAAAVKTGMDFDAQMSKVQAISGATSNEFEQLRDKAIQMGNDTKFSAYESAQAFEYMAMAGWKTEDMLNGIEGIMNLAAASGEDLALTSDIVTDALTAFGMSAGDAGHFADILAAASSNSNTNVAMMGETFKYVAPLFGAMNYSAEDAALAIGLMANSGIKASSAGTSLRNILQRMAKPTKESSFAMEQLGISLTDADGNMKSFRDVIYNMRDAFDGVNLGAAEYVNAVAELDEQLANDQITQKEYDKQLGALTERMYGAEAANKAQYAAMLAGSYGLSGYLAIVNATDEDLEKLENAIDSSSSVMNGQGEAARQAEVMIDNFKGSVTLLASALTTMAIEISDRVTPYIERLTEWIKGLVDSFNSLSKEQQDQIIKWALIAAAIGPVLLIVSKLLGAVAGIIGAVKTIGSAVSGLVSVLGGLGSVISFVASNPIVLIIAAIGLLVGALIYLWNTSEGFRDFFVNLWDGIKNTLSTVGEAIGTFFSETFPGFFENAGKAISDFFSGIGEFFAGIPERIIDFFTEIGERVSEGIPESFKSIGDAVGTFFTQTVPNFFSGFGETVGGIKDFVVEKFGLIKEGILDFVEGPLTDLQENFDEAMEVILGPIRDIGGRISGFFDDAIQVVSDIGSRISEAFDATFGEAGRSIGAFFTETIPEFFNNFSLSTIPEFIASIDFSELPYKLGYAVGEMLGHLFLFAQDAWNWITVDLPEIILGIGEKFGELPEKIGEWFSKTLEKVTEWGSNLLESGGEAVSNFVDGVGEFLTGLPGKFTEKFNEVVTSIGQWATTIWENGKHAASVFVENVSTAISELPGKVKTWLDENIKNLGDWAKEVFENAQKAGKDFMDSVTEFFSQLPGKIKEWFDETIQNTIEWFNEMTTKASETGQQFLDNVIKFFTELPGKMWDKLTEAFEKVTRWGSDMIKKGGEVASDFIDNVIKTIKELPGKIWDIIKGIPNKILEIKNDMKESGKGIINSLFDGMKKIGETVVNWVKGFARSIGDFVSGILSGFRDVVSGADEARRAARSVNGSHANGLDYVPFNGYIAELHEGERVLTKQENREYSSGTRGGGDTYVFYNTQPDAYEYARQMKRAKKELIYGF